MDYNKYLKLQEEEAGTWDGAWADQMLFAFFDALKYYDLESKILDIGCNLGRSLLELNLKGYKNVYGVDLIESKTLHARKLGLNALTANMEDLSIFSNNYFDFAFMSHAIEHSLNPEKAIEEMLRVSKSGLIICPIEESNKQNTIDTPHTSPFYSAQEWTSLFDKFSNKLKTYNHTMVSRLGKEVWTRYET